MILKLLLRAYWTRICAPGHMCGSNAPVGAVLGSFSKNSILQKMVLPHESGHKPPDHFRRNLNMKLSPSPEIRILKNRRSELGTRERRSVVYTYKPNLISGTPHNPRLELVGHFVLIYISPKTNPQPRLRRGHFSKKRLRRL